MPIESTILVVLTIGFAVGALIGWLAARTAHAHLQTELEKDRAVHAERLKAYQDADARLRDSFQALSADALKTNNEAFLQLAETRLGQARTQATSDIDARSMGPVQGRKFTPAAIETVHARMRLSMPSRS